MLGWFSADAVRASCVNRRSLCYDAVQPRVPRFVDDAHAALANLLENLVMCDDVGGHVEQLLGNFDQFIAKEKGTPRFDARSAPEQRLPASS